MKAPGTRRASVEDRRRLQTQLVSVLVTAAGQRSKRQTFVPDSCGVATTEWVVFERQIMLDAVNAERTRRGLPLVDALRIARVERSACGHIDYVEKYARYCTEIALGDGDDVEERARKGYGR